MTFTIHGQLYLFYRDEKEDDIKSDEDKRSSSLDSDVGSGSRRGREGHDRPKSRFGKRSSKPFHTGINVTCICTQYISKQNLH